MSDDILGKQATRSSFVRPDKIPGPWRRTSSKLDRPKHPVLTSFIRLYIYWVTTLGNYILMKDGLPVYNCPLRCVQLAMTKQIRDQLSDLHGILDQFSKSVPPPSPALIDSTYDVSEPQLR
jgi:hypothetical protein